MRARELLTSLVVWLHSSRGWLITARKLARLAEIDAKKFADTVAAIGADTIAAIAEAGPATQAKLLQGLGIQSMLITDGTSPVNLFNTANGLVGGSAGGGAGMNMPALGA